MKVLGTGSSLSCSENRLQPPKSPSILRTRDCSVAKHLHRIFATSFGRSVEGSTTYSAYLQTRVHESNSIVEETPLDLCTVLQKWQSRKQ